MLLVRLSSVSLQSFYSHPDGHNLDTCTTKDCQPPLNSKTIIEMCFLEFVLEFSVLRRITGQTVEGTRVPEVEEVCLMLLFVNSK